MARVSTPALAGTVGTTDNAIVRADGTGGNTAQGSTPVIQDSGRVDISVSGTGVPCLTLTQGNSGEINSPLFNFVGDSYVVGASEGNVGPEGGNVLLACGYVKCSWNGASTFTGSVDRQLYVQLCYEDCFEEGTMVITPSGPKPIESIQEGDEVISYNHDINEQRVNIVKKVSRHPNASGRIKINNHERGVSKFHRLWINDEYKKVTELKVGDYLRNSKHEKVWVFQLDWDASAAPTYNLEMQNQKMANYFASLSGLDVDSWLVHNKCPFLYFYNENAEYPWICQGTFITGFDSAEKKATSRTKLKDFSNKYYIRELEPETSYIEKLQLIAVTPSVEMSLQRIDKRAASLTLSQGDIIPIEFEPIPEGTTELYLEATGYYIENK